MIRPLYGSTAERARMAEVVERLRYTGDPQELAERICRESADALESIGLWHAAGMIDPALTIPPGVMGDLVETCDPPPAV